MLKAKLFKEKGILDKILFSIKKLPEDKTFYSAISLFGIFICAFLLLTTYSKNYTSTVAKKGTTLEIYTDDSIRYLMPLYATNNIEKFVSTLMYSSLVKKIDDKYINDLAEKITINDDGTDVEIKLRDDIYFADGTQIRSEDIIFTYELASNIIIEFADRVKFEGLKFEALDDKNLKLTIRKPYSNLNYIMTLGIVKKADYLDEGIDNIYKSNLSFSSTESGIYKVSKINRDAENNIQSINLVHNKYSSTLPNHKFININTEADLSQKINTIASDEISNALIFDVNNKQYENLLKDKYIKNDYTLPRVTALYLNASKNNLFANKENRKLIYNAIDRAKLVNNILSGYATATYGLLPNSKNNALTDDTNNSINSTSSVFSTSTVMLTLINSKSQIEIGEYIKSELSKIGMKIELNPVENIDIVNNNIKNRDFEMLLYSVEVDDPITLYAFWHSSQRNAPGYNFTGYASKDFDNNLEIIKSSTNTEQINNSLNLIEKEFYTEYPYIPLYTQSKTIYNHTSSRIYIPNHINNYKELTENIEKWYTEEEKIYNFITKYEDKINKIYKIIH